MRKLKLFHLILACAYWMATAMGPSLHLLVSHADAHASSGAALEEFCGGAENPCSRPNHDHSHSGHDHKVCFLCKASSVSSLHALESKIFNQTDLPSQIILEAAFHFRFETDLLSENPRAPPIFLA